MSRLAKKDDAYGQEILAILEGREAPEIIERDDGYIEAYGGAYLFAPFSKWDASERKAIRLARGRVLDIGAGGGRVSLFVSRKEMREIAT